MTARNRIGHFSQMVKTAKDKQARGRTPQEIAEDDGMSDAAVRAELGDTADLEALPNLRKLADGRTGETAYPNHEKQHGQQR
jgi:hypothetical protein